VLWGVIGFDTYRQKEISFGVALVIVSVVLVWVSDVFMRVVDMPSVRFTRWVEGKMIARAQPIKEEPAWRESGTTV
jgi:uncharacterized protein HemY